MAAEALSRKRPHDVVATTPIGPLSTSMVYDGDKKMKAGIAPPSKVLHVRGLPVGITELEIAHICLPQSVTRVKLLATSQQAFVEFPSMDAAAMVLARYAAVAPSIRGKRIYFQYSNRTEVTSEPKSVHNMNGLGAVVAGGSGLHGHNSDVPPNTILLASIQDARLKVTIENLYDIFSRYGSVLRIITFFTRTHELKALVQMDCIDSAALARSQLEGKDIFLGCCHLRINYSTLKELRMTGDDPAKQRDFTIHPMLPSSSSSSSAPSSSSSSSLPTPSSPSLTATSNYMVHPQQSLDLYAHQQQQQHQQQQAMASYMASPYAQYGIPPGMATAYTAMTTGMNNISLLPASTSPSARNETKYTGSTPSLYPISTTSPTSASANVTTAPLFSHYSNPTAAATLAATIANGNGVVSPTLMGHHGHHFGGGIGGGPGMNGGMNVGNVQLSDPLQQQMGGPGCVLIINRLPLGENAVTPDQLFMLFGVYGDVVRVKILFSKRDCALVQFVLPSYAQQAMAHLNKLSFFGQELSIAISKHQDIVLPAAALGIVGQTSVGDDLTRDYTNSPVHRFRNRVTRGNKNIYAPSQVLHLSNIADGVTAEAICKVFADAVHAPALPVLEFFAGNHKMAYIRMATQHDAVIALMRLHNTKLDDRSYLRVSFSSKDPATIRPSPATAASSLPSSSSLFSTSLTTELDNHNDNNGVTELAV